MKIISKTTPKCFGILEKGQCARIGVEGDLFMKTESLYFDGNNCVNAVYLKDGSFTYFDDEEAIIVPKDVKVVIE